MTTLREAAQQALEAYDKHEPLAFEMEALRAALAEPPDSTKPAVEPIGWLEAPHGEFRFNTRLKHEFPPQSLNWRIPLYALAEPVQEPVAWSFEARHIDSAWGAAVSLKHPGPEGVYMRNVKPLYLAPPQRKPLTDDAIEKAYREIWRDLPNDFEHTFSGWIEMGIKYAERAHGIGGAA